MASLQLAQGMGLQEAVGEGVPKGGAVEVAMGAGPVPGLPPNVSPQSVQGQRCRAAEAAPTLGTVHGLALDHLIEISHVDLVCALALCTLFVPFGKYSSIVSREALVGTVKLSQ